MMAVWKQLVISAVLLAAAAVVFALVSFGPSFFTGTSATASAPAGPGGRRPAPLVVLAPVETATTDSVVKSVGTAQAIERTTLYPETAGRVERIGVASGQRVDRGELIMQLDDHVQQFAVDRARLALADAEDTVARYETLAAQETLSDVELRNAVLLLEKARLDLREAEDALARRAVRAPFSGDIGLIDIGAGDYVTTVTPVTTLDDRSTILVEFRIPERFAHKVRSGLPMTLSTPSLAGLVLDGEVAGTDSRIDAVSRTLTVQGVIANDRDMIRPGMSFEVSLAFAGEPHPSVPAPAVLWDQNGSYVFKAEDDRAMRVPVTIVSRQAGQVLVDGDIAAGDSVVTEGTQAVRTGQRFRTLDDAAAPGGARG